ncbi:MAG: glycerol kinase GlpK [Phycisphaerales bacterium]
MPCLLALDQGTTSSRAIVFSPDGRVLSSAQRELPQIYPRPGWVEHDAHEIWRSQLETAQEALNAQSVDRADVAALSITNQRETTVVWDRSTGEPIGNAIVWQDRRTAPLCARLRADGLEPLFTHRTGLLLDPYFSGTKLAWILDNVPRARERAARGELAFGTVDSWLVHKLTRGRLHVTDASNASRTLLFNIHTADWDDELLERLAIPRAVLPQVRGSAEVLATTHPSLELAELPIAGLLGDQQAATLAQACLHPGMAKCTYGTGCFLLMNTGAQATVSANRLLTTVAWRLGDSLAYCLEGSVFVAGAAVQWLRDGLGVIDRAEEVEPLAASVEDSGGVVFVPALAGLGAPHWDPNARGIIAGITRGTTAAHIARATLEGIACQVVDLVEAMEADAGRPIKELRVDGGAAGDELLLQIQADLLQRPVVRPRELETTALGAACAGALATGVFNSTDDISAIWQEGRRLEPRLNEREAGAALERWRESVERAKGWTPRH